MRISRLYSNFHGHCGIQRHVMTGGGGRDGASTGGGAGGVGRKTLGKKCPKYSRGPQTGPALLGPQLAVATRWNCNFSLQLLCILQPNRARNFSATQLLYATQLLCILQPKGARNFRATDLVFIPTNSHAALGLIKNCQ